ncbi:MAG: beta-ketoacyl synthase [Bacteroidetes bacterium]|nr:beta-ketoacyl synthase [Bacteroidota bacterium]HET6244609.1 beta-ketoacyl synthase N-terminal-like domain-containing protein [Bacteroidia bacterium]
MQKVFVESHNILSPLGNTTLENFIQVQNGHSGVKLHHRKDLHDEGIWASIIGAGQFEEITKGIINCNNFTRFEKLLIASINNALITSSVDLSSNETIFIFSTTKGSIELLEKQDASPELYERMSLHNSCSLVSNYFKNENKPVIISNACVSGVTAILYARRVLASGSFKNAVIVGADTFSKFVFSGFLSFQALSQGRCSPFSNNRDGINLGEAAATIIITTQAEYVAQGVKMEVLNGAISNDSNHISGPSRTGQELSTAIDKAIQLSGISAKDIGFISAHGTATLFNDEMEAKAFNLSGLQNTPVNSLKGYFGHTLGAAGLVESIISILSLKQGIVIPTAGFSELGVSPPINVCNNKINNTMRYFLKTASGFGGCNATLVFSKS